MTIFAGVYVCQWTGGCAERKVMARYSPPHLSLVISVDAELSRVAYVDANPSEHVSLTRHRARMATLQSLLQEFDAAQVPATWCFSDPATSQFIPALADANTRHEVALLGDASWVSHEAGRRGLCRQLVQRVGQARKAGVDVSSLALYDGELIADHDLLAKQQISMVRYPRNKRSGRRQTSRQRSLRYGLWEAPTAIRLSPATLLTSWQSRYAMNRLLSRLSRHGGVGHLAIDLTASKNLAAGGGTIVRRLLKAISSRQRSAPLQVITLRELAQQWQPCHEGVTAMSLLKAVA